jgi:hypothetical protein
LHGIAIVIASLMGDAPRTRVLVVDDDADIAESIER